MTRTRCYLNSNAGMSRDIAFLARFWTRPHSSVGARGSSSPINLSYRRMESFFSIESQERKSVDGLGARQDFIGVISSQKRYVYVQGTKAWIWMFGRHQAGRKPQRREQIQRYEIIRDDSILYLNYFVVIIVIFILFLLYIRPTSFSRHCLWMVELFLRRLL